MWLLECISDTRKAKAMLRVSYSNDAGRQRWSLCGRLAGLWVQEVRSFWRQVHEKEPGAHVTVDLREVVFIDEAGQSLLEEMHSAGTEFVTAGVENNHLIATLKKKDEPRRSVSDVAPLNGKAVTAKGEER